MKNTIFRTVTFVLLIILTFSCKKKKDEEQQIKLAVSPGETFLSATPGQIKTFTVSASSEVKLNRLRITYKEEGGAIILLLDSLLETKEYTIIYPFQIPDYGTQNKYLNLYFDLSDADGNSATVAKGIDVLYTNRSLTEIVDNELYSRNSGQPSAYNLRASSSLVYNSPFTEDMNITDSLQADSLSKSWISPAGGFFVRKNTFNYEDAKLSGLKKQFENSAKTNKIANLSIGDIILYKQTYGTEVFYAAIKITNIQNNSGSSNDKYMFDIKK